MATALFQCNDSYTAMSVRQCLPSAPVSVQDFKYFGNLCAVIFNGDCGNMYWWCMNIACQSNHTCAFIGIDEKSFAADDKYKLALLTGDHAYIARSTSWDNTSLKYYSELIETFMSAVAHMTLTTQQIAQICSQCNIGRFEQETVNLCIASVNICSVQGRQCNYCNVLGYPSGGLRDDNRANAMVRVMAHFCYLDAAVRPHAGRLSGRFRTWLYG